MFHELSGRQFVWFAFSTCNEAICFSEAEDAVCCGKCVFLPAFSPLTTLEELSRTNDPKRRSKRTPAAGACARFPELASRRPHPKRPAHKCMLARIEPRELTTREEALAREASHELRRHRKMHGIDEYVVGEIKLFKQGNAPEEFRMQQESMVWFALSDVANPNQLGVSCKSFQLRTDAGGPQINPSDHTKNERSVCGQFEKPSSLFQRLPRLNYHRSLKSVAI